MRHRFVVFVKKKLSKKLSSLAVGIFVRVKYIQKEIKKSLPTSCSTLKLGIFCKSDFSGEMTNLSRSLDT